MHLLLGQRGQKLTECREDREPNSPAVTILTAEQRGLAHDRRRRTACGEETLDGFGDNKAQIMSKAVRQPPTPMLDRVGVTESRPHPDLVIAAYLHGTSRHVVGPQIESAPASQLEARMMPMTCEDTILDTAPIQRETHMRAAIVEGEAATTVIDHQDRGMTAMKYEPALGLQLGETAGAHKIRGRHIHRCRS